MRPGRCEACPAGRPVRWSGRASACEREGRHDRIRCGVGPVGGGTGSCASRDDSSVRPWGFLARARLLPLVTSAPLPPESWEGRGGACHIDVHCDVFHGSDLQVERFLALVAAATFGPFLRKLIQCLALPLQRSVRKNAPQATYEYNKLGTSEIGAALLARDWPASTRSSRGDRRDLRQRFSRNSRRRGEAVLEAYRSTWIGGE